MHSNLKRIRRGFGMTQADLAPLLGVTPGMVGHYERGLYELPPALARKLVAHAGSVGQVLTFDEIYAPAGEPEKAAA